MFRGTKKAIIEIAPAAKGKTFVWRKVGPNGREVCVSSETFTARRYAAVAGHREYPKLPVLHRYGNQRLDREADSKQPYVRPASIKRLKKIADKKIAKKASKKTARRKGAAKK